MSSKGKESMRILVYISWWHLYWNFSFIFYLFLLHRRIKGISGALLSPDVTRASGIERVVHHSVPGVLGEVRGDVQVALLLVPGSKYVNREVFDSIKALLCYTLGSKSSKWNDFISIFSSPKWFLVLHRIEECVLATLKVQCSMLFLLRYLLKTHSGWINPGRYLQRRLLHQGRQDQGEDHGQTDKKCRQENLKIVLLRALNIL